MSEDKNQQKTGKQLLNDTQEAAERAHLLREMNPTSAQLETELKHEKRKHSYNRACAARSIRCWWWRRLRC